MTSWSDLLHIPNVPPDAQYRAQRLDNIRVGLICIGFLWAACPCKIFCNEQSMETWDVLISKSPITLYVTDNVLF